MDRISTGNPEADLILGGGFPAHSINIVMGQPGAGKTVFAEQLAFANATEGRPVLFLTTLSEPLAKVLAYSQGLTFADPAKIGKEVLYDNLADVLTTEPGKLGERVLELLKTHRPRIIVFDSFKAIGDVFPNLALWRRTLYELAGLLTAYDATCFWVGEYSAEMVSRLPEFAVADGIVELTREQTGTRDDRYLHVVKLRGSGFLDGLHFFRITARGLDIFPRLTSPDVAPDYTPTPERVLTGVAGLDRLVETGWFRGTTTLIAGPSGAGKTVLGLHFLREGVCRGEPGLLLALQENPSQLKRIVSNFGWAPDHLLSRGKLDVLYASSVELQIDTLVADLFRRLEHDGVRRVVIDALGDVEKGARDTVRFRDYLYALSQHFAVRNVTAIFLLESPGRPLDSSGLSGRDISYISDNTLLLQMHLGADIERTIRVLKSRASAHDGNQHALRIGAEGATVE